MPPQANFRGKERKEGLDRAIPGVGTEAWFCKIIPIKDHKTIKALIVIDSTEPCFLVSLP